MQYTTSFQYETLHLLTVNESDEHLTTSSSISGELLFYLGNVHRRPGHLYTQRLHHILILRHSPPIPSKIVSTTLLHFFLKPFNGVAKLLNSIVALFHLSF